MSLPLHDGQIGLAEGEYIERSAPVTFTSSSLADARQTDHPSHCALTVCLAGLSLAPFLETSEPPDSERPHACSITLHSTFILDENIVA
jgi:hypothetical protein